VRPIGDSAAALEKLFRETGDALRFSSTSSGILPEHGRQ
jgi:hypothetical protein